MLTKPRASFAHGVPSHITKGQYDVPIPIFDDNNQPSQPNRGHDCFLALCSLTEILGEVLPLVYNLGIRGCKDAGKRIRRIKVDLDEWEEACPEWMAIGNATVPPLGSSSLKLGFLAVKMLVCRLALKVGLFTLNIHVD